MRFNQHQQKLWQNMIDLIEDYMSNRTDNFYDLVGKLEGALDAAEFTDIKLVNEWYDVWTPLEIIRAVEGNVIDKTKVISQLTAMKNFLLMRKIV